MSSFPLLLLWYFRLEGVSSNFRCNTNTQVRVLCSSFLKLLLHDKTPLDCEWRIWFCMWIWTKTRLPCWQCPCTAQTQPLGHACRAVSSWCWMLRAVGKHPACIPQAVGEFRARGEQSSVCSAAPAVWTPWGGDFASSTYKWKLLK